MFTADLELAFRYKLLNLITCLGNFLNVYLYILPVVTKIFPKHNGLGFEIVEAISEAILIKLVAIVLASKFVKIQ